MAIILTSITDDNPLDIPLTPGKTVVLGRSSKCDVTLSDTLVSGRHLEVSLNEQLVITVKNLSATNGSFLNGVQFEESSMELGSTLKIGRLEFQIDETELTEIESVALATPPEESLPIVEEEEEMTEFAKPDFLEASSAEKKNELKEQPAAQEMPRPMPIPKPEPMPTPEVAPEPEPEPEPQVEPSLVEANIDELEAQIQQEQGPDEGTGNYDFELKDVNLTSINELDEMTQAELTQLQKKIRDKVREKGEEVTMLFNNLVEQGGNKINERVIDLDLGPDSMDTDNPLSIEESSSTKVTTRPTKRLKTPPLKKAEPEESLDDDDEYEYVDEDEDETNTSLGARLKNFLKSITS